VLPIILKGILSNSSLSNRAELMMALEKMSQPDPAAEQAKQQAEQQAQQAQMAMLMAQVQDLQAAAQKKTAEVEQIKMDTQLAPSLAQAKLAAALSNNLDDNAEGKDFEQRAKMTELMLKERGLDLQENDSIRNERITMMQMKNTETDNTAFSDLLNG
jgi:hypothetical protein